MKKLELIAAHIRTVLDFPKLGIHFQDITPLLSNPDAFAACIDLMAEAVEPLNIDYIACPEARGFIFGAPLAYRLSVGITLIRKAGKLPADTHSQHFNLEYGQDAFEIHQDAFKPNAKVLIIDDVLATGGSAVAAMELIKKAGGSVAAAGFLLELSELNGNKVLEQTELPYFSLLST